MIRASWNYRSTKEAADHAAKIGRALSLHLKDPFTRLYAVGRGRRKEREENRTQLYRLRRGEGESLLLLLLLLLLLMLF